jgi:hypothetical protein
MKTNLRKAFQTYKFLHGFSFKVRIGLPSKIAYWIAKKLFPPAKGPKIVVESGWVKESADKNMSDIIMNTPDTAYELKGRRWVLKGQ